MAALYLVSVVQMILRVTYGTGLLWKTKMAALYLVSVVQMILRFTYGTGLLPKNKMAALYLVSVLQVVLIVVGVWRLLVRQQAEDSASWTHPPSRLNRHTHHPAIRDTPTIPP